MLNRTIDTLFNRDKAKSDPNKAVDDVVTLTVTPDQKPVLPLDPKFVTKEQFLSASYDPDAVDDMGRKIWLEPIKNDKTKKSRPKPLMRLTVSEPEKFITHLADRRTPVVARTLKANKHLLPALQELIIQQPDNVALYACLALLSDDIKSLDLGQLIKTEAWLKTMPDSPQQLSKTINIMIELRNQANLADFLKTLATRSDEDYYLNLAGLDFADSNITDANLNYVNLCNTTFANATITNSVLRHADMRAASFTNVKFLRLDLSCASFIKAKFLNWDKSEIIYRSTEFIHPEVKLDKAELARLLTGLHQLNIPAYVIYKNALSNINNKNNDYSLLEKHELVGEMGLHRCFNEDSKNMSVESEYETSLPTREKCREMIQRKFERLSHKISKTANGRLSIK